MVFAGHHCVVQTPLAPPYEWAEDVARHRAARDEHV